jgi:hypothetical protein
VVEGITNENEKSTCVDMKFNSVPGATFAFSWNLPMPVNFSDLAAGVAGQSVGEGANAAITLDTTATGNGWFIDATPADNSEFLPTSNPNEWVAKSGSAAAGKMDMLSVLLHEYGIALVGFLRPNCYGGANLDITGAVAANPAFVDLVGWIPSTMPDNARPSSWNAKDSVDIKVKLLAWA